MIFIGVDPGKNGAYAAITPGKYEAEIEVFPWDDIFFIHHMHALRATGSGCKACVEKVGAMPGQGVTGMFHFGKNAGFIEGVLAALGIPYQLVVPRKWKAEFGLSGSKADSIEVCRKLFPDVKLRASERCRKDSDGMAEALLMAEYARRHF